MVNSQPIRSTNFHLRSILMPLRMPLWIPAWSQLPAVTPWRNQHQDWTARRILYCCSVMMKPKLATTGKSSCPAVAEWYRHLRLRPGASSTGTFATALASAGLLALPSIPHDVSAQRSPSVLDEQALTVHL